MLTHFTGGGTEAPSSIKGPRTERWHMADEAARWGGDARPHESGSEPNAPCKSGGGAQKGEGVLKAPQPSQSTLGCAVRRRALASRRGRTLGRAAQIPPLPPPRWRLPPPPATPAARARPLRAPAPSPSAGLPGVG